MKKVDIKHIANLNSESVRGLDFYLDELKIMQERLDEIAAANTGEEVLKKIDHFQDASFTKGLSNCSKVRSGTIQPTLNQS
jgi:histidyl-tRNA synthetase